jgi:hypothetical protein
VAGSMNRLYEQDWPLWRSLEYQCRAEQTHGKEQFVDDSVKLQLINFSARSYSKNSNHTLVVLTGDGNWRNQHGVDDFHGMSFPDVLEKLLRNDFMIEVWAWQQSCSQFYEKMQKAYGEAFKVVYLDQWREYLTYGQGKDDPAPPMAPEPEATGQGGASAGGGGRWDHFAEQHHSQDGGRGGTSSRGRGRYSMAHGAGGGGRGGGGARRQQRGVTRPDRLQPLLPAHVTAHVSGTHGGRQVRGNTPEGCRCSSLQAIVKGYSAGACARLIRVCACCSSQGGAQRGAVGVLARGGAAGARAHPRHRHRNGAELPVPDRVHLRAGTRVWLRPAAAAAVRAAAVRAAVWPAAVCAAVRAAAVQPAAVWAAAVRAAAVRPTVAAAGAWGGVANGARWGGGVP